MTAVIQDIITAISNVFGSIFDGASEVVNTSSEFLGGLN